jgi:hypothetical protein
MQRIDLRSALMLILIANAPCEIEQKVEAIFQSGIAGNLAADVADDAAEPCAQELERAAGALELVCVNVTPHHDCGPFGHAPIALPQRDVASASRLSTKCWQKSTRSAMPESRRRRRRRQPIGSNALPVSRPSGHKSRPSWERKSYNRRGVASYLGLTPSPFQSGGMSRDQGITKAGDPRGRTVMIELAWLWLRYQPQSRLARWFEERTKGLTGRVRRIVIVAVARKTGNRLVALSGNWSPARRR